MAALLEVRVGLGPGMLPQWQGSEKLRKEEKVAQAQRGAESNCAGAEKCVMCLGQHEQASWAE